MMIASTKQQILMEIDPTMTEIKLLYGYVESVKLWFDLLSATLLEHGYVSITAYLINLSMEINAR